MGKLHYSIPTDTLVDGATICFKNAYRLAHDAKLLFASGRYSTCISVAVLALEEVGKGYMLMRSYKNTQTTIVKIPKSDFTSHKKKLEIISTTFEMISKNNPNKKKAFKQLSMFMNRLLKKKMESWYVDWDEGQKQWCYFDDRETDKEKIAEDVIKATEILIVSFMDDRGHDDDLKFLTSEERSKLFSACKIYCFCNKCGLPMITRSEFLHHGRIKSHGGYISWHHMPSEINQ